MIIASYGGGVNSTAMLIEYANRGLNVDLILFADTGAERPHTQEYIKTFSKYLKSKGLPEIIIVKKTDIKGEVLTLEQDCLNRKQLPSLAYGFKTCSQKYKIQPQDKFVNNWEPAKQEWKKGNKITKLIGYDADEEHRTNKNYEDKKYNFIYPLVEWEMGRDDCVDIIEKSGLCQPGKSACFFCPSSKKTEIKQLKAVYPELAERALLMERNAELTSIKGLGRSFNWGDLMSNQDLFTDGYFETPEMVCGCYDG